MWRHVINTAKQLFTLNQSIEQHERDIQELRRELKELSLAMEKMRHELQNLRESERHEREKNLLQLENIPLKFQRHLPASKQTRRNKQRNASIPAWENQPTLRLQSKKTRFVAKRWCKCAA